MPASARAARRFVTETLETWGLDDLAYDAATIVSELATNAIVHACGDNDPADEFHVTLTADFDQVTITVTDPGGDDPTELFPGEPHVGAESGRGLGIVAAYSDDWGWQRQPATGKIVWAILDISRFESSTRD